jgi:alpha-tubulin suppressor-like RCC1 family protein
MNSARKTGGNVFIFISLLLGGFFLPVLSGNSAPRPLVPPYPSFGAVFREGFDQPYGFATNQVIDPTVWTESWSGWALNRQGSVVAPWVVPMVVSNSFRVEPERGAMRFWYQPDFTSGVGPGQEATLLTLVTAQGKAVEVWWTLMVSADGAEVRLVCQRENGPESCLIAEVEWAAGSWHLLTLGFTPTNSVLFIDDQIAAVGEGLGPIPNEAAPFTCLIVGSDAGGNAPARGQVEELHIFSGRNRMQQIMGNPFGLSVDWEIETYYSALSQIAVLGPVSDEEIAARRAQAEKRKAEREALELEEGSSSQMLRFAGYTSECVTNAPLYITNTVCVFDTNTAWTVTFDIQGTNGPADIFVTTNLSDHLTNSHWVWLERGPSCSTYQYTNQPESRAFFILGTPTDTDGDGLTDAYELLVSKTLVSTNDTDADGIPDAWEVAHGLDPLDPADASDDPDGDWLTNLQEYNGGTNSTNPRDVMVVAWGQNFYGQLNVPANLRNVTTVTGGQRHSLALRSDGTITGWGGNALDETNIPPGLSNVVTLTANGYDYTASPSPTAINLALKTDGTVTQWGTVLQAVPANLSNVIVIAAGAFHALALRNDGSVVVWGETNLPAAQLPVGLTGVRSIAAGFYHTVAVLSNGTVGVWGINYPTIDYTMTNIPPGLTEVAVVSARALHTLALRRNGTVVAWGYNQFGQTNVPTGLSNVTMVAAGSGHSMALKHDGTVAVWGAVTALPGLNQVSAIGAGSDHCLAVRSGRLLPFFVQQPDAKIELPDSAVTFASVGLGLAGVKYQWQFNGVNLAGQTNANLTVTNISTNSIGGYTVVIATGAGALTSRVATLTLIGPPVITNAIPNPPSTHWFTNGVSAPLFLQVQATALETHRYPLRYQWFTNGGAIAGATNAYYTHPISWVPLWQAHPLEADYTVQVWNPVGTNQTGPWTVRVVSPPNAGSTVAWGNNDHGQSAYPVDLTNTLAVAAGEFHAVVVKEDGTLAQWGVYSIDGIVTEPVGAPPAHSNLVAVAAGAEHDLALKSDGTVVTWGLAEAFANYVPANLAGVTAIAAGWNHNVALLTNGTVTAWGYGNQTLGWTMTNVPPGLSNVTAIAAGGLHSLALRSNGTVVSWGYNDSGETNVPSGLSNVVAVAAGGRHSLALKADGTIVGWGFNNSGQCTPPTGLSNVMAIAAGWAHSAALQNDGTVICWGDNSQGQTNVPPVLRNVKLLAAGGDHTLAGVFSPLVQYPVDVTKDLLLIFNTNSINSIVVKDYYLAHRPMVGGANVLGINCTTNELTSTTDFTNQILAPYLNWLNQNPTKHPQYIILFPEIPTRVWGDVTNDLTISNSVPFGVYQGTPGIRPFITSINMGLDLPALGASYLTNDCIGYIDKLAAFGTNGSLFISASEGAYGNINFVLDNVRHGAGWPFPEPNFSGYGGIISVCTNVILNSGIPGLGVTYLDGIEVYSQPPLLHITNAANVAGYMSWGSHSRLGNEYSRFGGVRVQWTGNSSWWVIETIESYNGQRATGQGNFTQWLLPRRL